MLSDDERAAMRERHRSDMGHLLDGDSGVPVCPKCRTLWPCDAERLLDALDEAEREVRLALDTLEDVIGQACGDGERGLDSVALSAYANGMRYLARHKRLVIDDEYGRRVIAHWPEETSG